jgi:hypothetical protein
VADRGLPDDLADTLCHAFSIDGESYITWQAMLAVGGMSGLGNHQGIIEWVFATKPLTRDSLIGAIVDGIAERANRIHKSDDG